jgi:molybdopterin converting factor small subunit
MRIEVLIFGEVSERLGADRVVVEVGGEPTVRGVLEALRAQWPGLGAAASSPETGRLAVNQAFASGDHAIRAGRDEVALVTLVGGG